jgi:hypothetical protein
MASLPELLRAASAAQASADPHRIRAARGRLHKTLRDTLPQDPLVAASCLAAVSDDELKDQLQPIADRVQARVGEALGLLTDSQGKGQVVEVLVELSPGGSGTWTAQNVERDALVAAQLAVAVALGADTERWGVRWQVRGTRAIRGSSLGLALAVATRAAQRGHEGHADHAFTGGVDLDGRVASVFGVPAKLRAAAELGLTKVTVPATELAGLQTPEGVVVTGAEVVEPLLEALFGREETVRDPSTPLRWLGLLVPLALAWTGATDPVDGLLQGPASRAALGVLEPHLTAVLPLPDTADTRGLRADYPRVFAELAAAGATAVVLDVTLGALTDHDAALATALASARAAGTPVIVPVVLRDGVFQGPGDPAVGAAALPGIIELEADALFGRVRRAPIQLRADDGSTRWHATVQAVASHLASEPELDGDVLRIGVTRNPVALDRLWLPPVAPSPMLDWATPGSGAAGKVVLIGRATGRADLFPTPSGRRYGVEIHAAAAEALASQAGLRRSTAASDTGLAAVTGVMTALMGLALPRRRRWLCLGVPALALGGVLLALGAGWLIAPTPLLLAGLTAWWAVR